MLASPGWAFRDGTSACEHLADSSDGDFWRVFDGPGRRFAYACAACAEAGVLRGPWLLSAEFVERLECDGDWVGCRGTPTALLASKRGRVRIDPQRIDIAGLRGVVPVVAGPGERWIALVEDGLIEFEGHEAVVRSVANVRADLQSFIDPLDKDPERARSVVLECDLQGRYVALAPAGGRYGAVIDTRTGVETMRLDRGDYHEDVCEFPLAFAEVDGRPVLIHGTAWNRVDCSDPASGRCLTTRPTRQHTADRGSDPHHLDYFFCGLAVSPSGHRIVSDGWEWHPRGVLCAWDIRTWLRDNVWEPEDGATRFTPDPRPEIWDGPLAWLDDEHLAVGGFGVDEHLHDGVRVFNVKEQKEIDWYPGPARRLCSDGSLLYSLAPELAAFDLHTAELVVHEPGLSPLARHPNTGRFIFFDDAPSSLRFATLEPPPA